MPGPVSLLLIGLIVYLWFRPPARVEEIALPAPDVPVSTTQHLSDLRGKVVLVNFWATWCPYCRHEMPAMQAFYDAHRACGFEIVAWSLDESASTVVDFMRRNHYTFRAPLVTPGVIAAFGGIEQLPTSFVIDREGVIRHRICGQMHVGRLEKLIGPLLKGSDRCSGPR